MNTGDPMRVAATMLRLIKIKAAKRAALIHTIKTLKVRNI